MSVKSANAFIIVLTTRKAAWYIISRASVCLFVCMYVGYVCLSDDNFQKPRRTKFSFAHPVGLCLHGILVKFVYEGHRVNVKVTGAQKGRKCLFMHWSTPVGHFYPYSTDGATREWFRLRLEGTLINHVCGVPVCLSAQKWENYYWSKISKLVRICVVLNPRSDSIMVTFELELDLW